MSDKSLTLYEGATVTQPDRRYWGITPTLTSELKYIYSIGILDLATNQYVRIPNADPAERIRGTAYFNFSVPPKMYEVVENAATNIVATQNGGKFVESHGNIFKELRIAGTVGLRPNPVPTKNVLPGGLTKATGMSLTIPGAAFAANILTGKPLQDERGLSPNEITGFDDIVFLRNLFRGYWDIKRLDNEQSRRIAMLWFYSKESEVYIVEPLSFTTNRDSGNPLSWNYAISLRTLYRFDQTVRVLSDPLNWFQKAENVWGTVKGITKDIVTAINQVANAVDFIANLPSKIIHAAASVAQDFVNSGINILRAVSNLRNIGTFLEADIKALGVNFRQQAEILGNYAKSIRYGIDGNNDRRVFGGSTINGNPPPPDSPPGLFSAPTDQSAAKIHLDQAIRATVLARRAASRLLSSDAFFAQNKQVVVNDYGEAYKDSSGDPPADTVTSLDPNNISMPSSAYEVVVTAGDTVRSLAFQYLGNRTFWKKLVIMNNLKYPYISNTTGLDRVLSPGDKLLVPKSPSQGDSSAVVQPSEVDSSAASLSPILRKYGRDISITKGTQTSQVSDVEVSQTGDIKLIEGTPNVNQALSIKFATEQGTLPIHPEFGASYPTGTKISLAKFQEFALNARTTVLQDSRIGSIKSLRFFADGDVLRVDLKALLKDSNIELSYDFAVRSY